MTGARQWPVGRISGVQATYDIVSPGASSAEAEGTILPGAGACVPDAQSVGYVPTVQEPRYSTWAGVRTSMGTFIVSSFRRAISESMSRGTS